MQAAHGRRWTSALLGWLALAVAAPAAAGDTVLPPVTYEVRIARYPVRGETLDELRRQLRHNPPGRDSDGRTRSDLQVNYEPLVTADGCRVSRLEVKLRMVTTLPEWEAPGGGDVSLARTPFVQLV